MLLPKLSFASYYAIFTLITPRSVIVKLLAQLQPARWLINLLADWTIVSDLPLALLDLIKHPGE